MSISPITKISWCNKWLNPFSGSIGSRLVKLMFTLSLAGGIYGGVDAAVNTPKLDVKASCSQELEKCMLDIKGINVNFLSHPPLVEVPSASGLTVETPKVFSKDSAKVIVKFDNANAGKWDVLIDGINYPKAIELGE